MTRQNKLVILIVYLLVIATALPVYRVKRLTATKRLQAEYSSFQGELARIKSAEAEMVQLRKQFPVEAHTAIVIEDLYDAAKLSKLASHEISTEAAPQQRSPIRSGQKQDELVKHRFKMNIEGSYRSIAEYIRQVQNMERFKQITEIRLTPGKQGVLGSITMDLYSLKGQHAN